MNAVLQPYMGAQVLLNFLNELGEEIKHERYELNEFNHI